MRSVALSFVAIAVPLMLTAQTGPTETVRTAFSALKAHHWQQLAALIDPGSLENFKQSELRALAAFARQQDEIAAATREGRGYSLDIHNELRPGEIQQVASVRIRTLADSPTMATLAAESASDFFVRLSSEIYGSRAEKELTQDIAGLERQLIGEIIESDTLVHVVYRREYRHVEGDTLWSELPGSLKIASLTRVRSRWLLKLGDDIGWFADFSSLLRDRRWPSPEFKRQTRITEAPSVSAGAPAARRNAIHAARDAFAAFENKDWVSLAARVHPKELSAFQRRQIAYLIAWERSKESRSQAMRAGTAFMLLYDDSLSDEELARAANVKMPMFGASTTIGELTHLSPAVFFMRWCETAYGPKSGHFGTWRTDLTRQVIGEAIENAAVAHVLYRFAGESGVELITLVREGDDWGIRFNSDIGFPVDLDMILHETDH